VLQEEGDKKRLKIVDAQFATSSVFQSQSKLNLRKMHHQSRWAQFWYGKSTSCRVSGSATIVETALLLHNSTTAALYTTRYYTAAAAVLLLLL